MKSSKNPTSWIDLTDMVSWRGHFTGIQRVVHSYASRFDQEGARFFIYDEIDNRHVEVGFDFLDHKDTSESVLVTVTKRKKAKQLLGKPYYSLSDTQRARLRPAVNFVNTIVRTAISKFVNAEPISALKSYPSVSFSQGDKVVLIGAGWNIPGSLELLCTAREERGIKIIQHINDILPIYQPHLFADELPKVFTPYIDTAVRNADAITVISQATKRDLEIFCNEQGIQTPAITVVRLGEDVQISKPIKPDATIPKNFALSLGTFEIRKNYILLYQAAKLAQLEGREFPGIVIVGRRGWLTEDLAHVIDRDPFTKGKIIWIDSASDAELEWLYSKCMFTIFPSLCEGWGLPIVESLQHGKICLASNVSSMLEIGDGLIDYFSPYDARSCMNMIVRYAGETVYKPANAKVKDSYRKYTWDDSFNVFRAAVEKA